MTESCKALNYPVVSGNVSLYNETNGYPILPTPTIGGVGILADVNKRVGNKFVEDGDNILLIGKTAGHLGSSLYLREIEGREEGAPPKVELIEELKNGNFVRGLIESGKITACHDISDGGLYVAVTEMVIGSGIGAKISLKSDLPLFTECFGEDQSRYVITVADSRTAEIIKMAKSIGVVIENIGTVGGDKLSLNDEWELSVAKLYSTNEAVLPEFMAG